MLLVSEGVKEQTRQSLENLYAIVEKAGYTKKNIVKCSICIKDMDTFIDVDSVYSEYFDIHKPARVTVEVAGLPKDVKVEIDAICIK